MQAKTVIITAPSSTGLQTISGIGFQGKLLLIHGMNRAGATTGAGAGWMFGAAVSSSSRWVANGRSDDAQAVANAGSRRATSACVLVANAAGTISENADFDSWTSDGFKLNWVATTATGRQFVCTVLGGSDFEAALGQDTTPGAIGNQAISGLSFQPNTVIIADCRLNNVDTGTSTFYRPSIGFFDENRNGGGWGGNSYDASDPTVTSRVQSTSGYVATASTDGGIDRRCLMSTYNSDGFTLNWTTLDASFGINTDFQWIAMSVPSSVKGNVAARTTTGNTVVSGLGHTPQLILLGGVESVQTTGTGDPTHNFALGMVGGTGATEQAVVAMEDRDNQATSIASTKWATGKALAFITAGGASPTDDVVASVTDIDFGEFTLNYTTVIGTAVQVVYLSIGTATVTNEGSFTADAIVRKTQTSGKTFTANATLKKTITPTVTANAVVKKTATPTATANAVTKKTASSSLTANAIVRKTATPTVTVNASLKKVVSGSVTGDAVLSPTAKAVWTTPANGALISATPTLTFLIPVGSGNMHFYMELDTVATFDSGDLRQYDSSVSQTNWQYWNGSGWVAVPSGGVPNSFAGNEARYNVTTPLANGTWYRRVRAGV